MRDSLPDLRPRTLLLPKPRYLRLLAALMLAALVSLDITGGPLELTARARAAPPPGPSASAGPARSCPCSVWNDLTVPDSASFDDARPAELGMKFQAEVDGFVTGVRFYKGMANTGTHVGNLWSSDGELLASVVFADESPAGWQQMSFPTPIPITANTTYVVSYHTDAGDYAASGGYFASSPVENAPLRALADGADGGNGIYAYGPSAFPTQTYNATNYWVDVVFVPAQ
jgi:hypothetical protein